MENPEEWQSSARHDRPTHVRHSTVQIMFTTVTIKLLFDFHIKNEQILTSLVNLVSSGSLHLDNELCRALFQTLVNVLTLSEDKDDLICQHLTQASLKLS